MNSIVRGVGMMLLGLFVVTSTAVGSGEKPLEDDQVVTVGRFWTLSPGNRWYRTKMDGGALFKYVEGQQTVYLYTGPRAPEPNEKNVRYRVLFQPYRPSESEAACTKALTGYEKLLAKDGMIRGELLVHGQPYGCWLAPDDDRTVYMVPMQWGPALLGVVVEITRPNKKFPKPALDLIETLQSDPEKLAGIQKAAKPKTRAKAPEKKPDPPAETQEEDLVESVVELIDAIGDLFE